MEEKVPLTIATPFPQRIFCSSIPMCLYPLWAVSQTPTRLLSDHLVWERLAFPVPCSAAFLCLSEEAQCARGAPGWGESQPLAAKGCGSLRILVWPAGMGSVSSALARSRNTVVQPGSSPLQPEVPLAAPASRKDSRTQRRQGSSRPCPAWEPPPDRHSQQELRKLESAELSPVLKRLSTMASCDPAGKF